MKKGNIGRRQFLRGSSFLLAMPVIESIAGPLLAQNAAVAKRFVSLYFDMGMSHKDLVYPSIGNILSLPTSSSALLPYKNKLLFLQNMKGPNIPTNVEPHLSTNAFFLTGFTPIPTQRNPNPTRTDGSDTFIPLSELRAQKSLDQILIDSWASQTPLRSLHLGSTCSGQTEHFGVKIGFGAGNSWKSATELNRNIDNPKTAFDNFFITQRTSDTPELALIRWKNQSVLDAVLDDYKRWENKLTGTDLEQLQSFAESVREYETEQVRLATPVSNPNQCNSPIPNIATFSNVSQQHRLYMDLISLAFRCDLTRTATVTLAHSFSDEIPHFFNHINNTGMGIHDISHNYNREPYKTVLQQVERDYIQSFAYLLEKINIQMDNTTVLFGSAMGRGDHQADNLPIILASGNGVGLKKGQNISLPNETLPNLHLTIQKAMGIANPSFIGSTRLLPILNS